VRDALTDQRFIECVCRGEFVSVAVLLALQFIMSAATCLRLVHGRSVSSCPSTPSVPLSVYVFVRACVRARAAADAAVGLSKSCFLVPLCSTLLLLGASTFSSSALLPSSPLLVSRRSSHIHGRATGRLVPILTHRHCVLGPSRFLQVTDGFVLSKGSSAALRNGCAVPCCHPLFMPVVV
jgi:hypothetical protein